MRHALRGVSEWHDVFGADVLARYRSQAHDEDSAGGDNGGGDNGGDSGGDNSAESGGDTIGDSAAPPQHLRERPVVPHWASCAVVGNSGSLLGTRLGAAIDAHSAVFRLNAAPTSTNVFKQRVGQLTHLRLLNNAKARGYLTNGCSRALPCDAGSTLVPVRGTPFPLASKMWRNGHASILAGHTPRAGEAVRDDILKRVNVSVVDEATGEEGWRLRPLGKVRGGAELGVALPPRNVLGSLKVMREQYRAAYTARCGEAKAKDFFRGPVTPSSGMMAIVIALSLCNTTSVFGFGTGTTGGYQYYHSRYVQSSAHSFDTEKRMIGVMGASGVVRVNGRVLPEAEAAWRAVQAAAPDHLAAMSVDD
jgi:hypothetical protein